MFTASLVVQETVEVMERTGRGEEGMGEGVGEEEEAAALGDEMVTLETSLHSTQLFEVRFLNIFFRWR